MIFKSPTTVTTRDDKGDLKKSTVQGLNVNKDQVFYSIVIKKM